MNSPLSSNGNFLAPNQCLVYVEDRRQFSDVDGYTYIAKTVRNYITDDKLWYDLLIETNTDGKKLQISKPITVSGEFILSDKAFHDISPRVMYHFTSKDIQARSFVIKSKLTKPLESTSRTALGSGVYGRYISDVNNLQLYITDPDQSVYTIDCSAAYPIQDKPHGESLTVASLNTNRFMDQFILALRSVITQHKQIDNSAVLNMAQSLINSNDTTHLFVLWNIVFHRTQDYIDKQTLDQLLAVYAVRYLTEINLYDTVSGEPIQELPVNNILSHLGYDGVIASDTYNNKWNRGCVSYNYSQAIIIRGEDARY